jgi:activating signal cointegrator 1
MKALTLWQPWASLVAMGEKCIETRCWSTDYRGKMAIHAAQAIPAKYLGASAETEEFRDELADVFNVRRDRDDRAGKHVNQALTELPKGAVLCIVTLLAIEEIDVTLRETLSRRERLFGNYDDGRFAWYLQLIEVFDPVVPAKGNRRLWNWEDVGQNRTPSEGQETLTLGDR